MVALAQLVHPTNPPELVALFDTVNSPNDKLAANVVAAMKVTKRGTIARRYVRSLLCGSMSRGEVNRLLGADSPDDGSAGDDDEEEDANILRITGKTFSRARRDWDVLRECGELTPAKYGRSKVADASLRVLLNFLFRPQNVVLASWGPNNVVIAPALIGNGSTTTPRIMSLPAVIPAKNGSVLHQEYCQQLQSRPEAPLSRGSFYAVLNTLTRRHITRVIPMDNATRCLVKDPLTLVRDLIIRLVPYTDRTQYLREVDKVEWFLCWSFAHSHLGIDNAAFHDFNFALKSSTLLSDPDSIHSRVVDCMGCVFPYCVIKEIEQLARLDQREEVEAVGKVCRDKFIDYMRYQCRQKAQDRALAKAVSEIQAKNMTNRVAVFVNYIHADWVQRSGKETKIPHIPDVGFHGSVVYYLDKKSEGGGKKNELKSLFYQHLVNTANMPQGEARDPAVVIFVIEALLRRIRMDIPQADEIILVTDNAPVFKNRFLPAFLPHLTRFQGMGAVRLLHTCSQTCEFLIDGLYEMITARVMANSYARSSRMTASRYAAFVNQDSNELNTVCEVLDLADECLAFTKKFTACRDHTGSFTSSVEVPNDIVYQDWQSSEGALHMTNVVKARLYQFAGTGKGETTEFGDHMFNFLRQHDSQDMHVAGLTVPSMSASQMLHTVPPSTAQHALPDMPFVLDNRVPQASRGSLGRIDIPSTTSSAFAWMGPVTGVRVLASSNVPRINRRGVSRSPEKVSGGLIADTLSRIRAIGTKKGVKLWQDNSEDLIGVHAIKTGIIGRSCPECNRSFKSERFLNSHQCKGPPADKDISARAVVLADEMFRNGELLVFRNSAEHLWKDSVLTDMDEDNRSITGVQYGWGLVETPPNFIESNTMLQYRKEVFELLDSNKGKRDLDARFTHSHLLRTYPGRDDIPHIDIIHSWCALRKAAWRIQPFCQIGLDGTAVLTYEEEAETGPGKSRMKDRYTAKLSEMHEQQLQLSEADRPKPRYMFKEFEDYFKDEDGRTPPDFPEMKQVMNKINALRSKSKRIDVR